MPTANQSNPSWELRLPSEIRHIVEEAAAQLGQSVNEFVVSSVIEMARAVIDEGVTDLSDRDRDLFLALINDADARPNEALMAAAERYKRMVGRDVTVED